MGSLTDLIAQTEESVRSLSKSYVKALIQPLYPVVIRLCAAPQEHERITGFLRSGMHKYWSDLAEHAAIQTVTGGISKDPAHSEQLLSRDIRSMLQSRQCFKNLAIILYFDIVQTGQFASLEAFQAYYQQYLAYQYDENHSISRMMFLIHDRPVDDPDQRKVAAEILNWVETECVRSKSVVVLSSQMYGGAEIASDDPSRYEAIATMISLTDIDSKPNFYAKLFEVERPSLFTLGRVYHEKPFHLIAVFTVNALIQNIMAHFSEANAVSVSADDLQKTFCPQTRFDLLEQYYDAAKAVLPGEDCMRYLPYQDTEGTLPENIRSFWQAFFEANFVSRITKKADEQYEMLRERFLDQLMQTFTHQQLAYLNHHPDVMDSFWGGLKTEQITLTDVDYRKAVAAVRSVYVDHVIRRLRADIHRILESANIVSNLLEQFESRMHDIVFAASANEQMAESVSRFYDATVVRPYVDQHWNQIRLDFSLVQNQTGETKTLLLELLEKYAQEIIRSNEIYRTSFENELQQRMTNDGLNDQLMMQSSRAVTTVTDYLMGSAMRQIYLPKMSVEEILEIYLIPEEAKYLHIVRQRLQETDAVQTISVDQYMERIALLRA